MIDPILVLNSTNTHVPGVVLGSLRPDGAGGYSIELGAGWMYGVLHYALQPVLLVLLLVVLILLVELAMGVVRK